MLFDIVTHERQLPAPRLETEAYNANGQQDAAAELVRRWNAHQVMHDALVEIAAIQESSNTWDPEDIGKALDNAVATAQGALRALKQDAQEDTQRTFSILIAYPDTSTWFGTGHGDTVEEAIEDARRQINEDNRSQYSDDELEVLAVIAGEHQDLKP